MSDFPKLNLLVAFPYMTKSLIQVWKENEKDIRFLLDSGAFTAWKAGKEIPLDDYCNFLQALPIKPWRYFTLDKVGDPTKSMENYQEMLRRGLSPIPIFTRGEDPAKLEEYYNTSDLVGIGGLVRTPGNKGFVKGIMKRIGSRKVHWLGFNAAEFVSHYKPYSCDSSSWAGSLRFGVILIYEGNGRWLRLGKKDFVNRPPIRIQKLISDYGIDINLFQQSSQWRNSGSGKCALEIIAYRSWVKYQIDVAEKLGVNFFLAVASDWQIKLMLDAYNFWRNKR